MRPLANLLQIFSRIVRKGALSQGALGAEIGKFSMLLDGVDPTAILPRKPSTIEFEALLEPYISVAVKSGMGEMAQAVKDAAPELNWSRGFAPARWDKEFLPHFANAEMAGPSGPIEKDDLTIDFSFIAPDQLLPPHVHSAVELSLVVAGWPTVRIGDGEARTHAPGSFVCQPSKVSQTVWSGPDGVFAATMWRGDFSMPAQRVYPAVETYAGELPPGGTSTGSS